MSFKVGDEAYLYSYWDSLPEEPRFVKIIDIEFMVSHYRYVMHRDSLISECVLCHAKEDFFSKEEAYAKYKQDLIDYIYFSRNQLEQAVEALGKIP